MIALRMRVFGRVQGVGFRYYTARQANNYDIQGWVRNREDGSVEIFAQGSEGKMRVFRECIERGPVYASISRIDVTEEKPDPSLRDFRIQP